MTKQQINPVFNVSQFDEVYLPSINRQTFEKIDSATLYRAKLKDLMEIKQHLFIIIGLDSGLLANYLLDASLPSGSKYIFVELDAVLELLDIDIPEHLSNKIQVMSFDEFKERITIDNNEIYITKDAISLHKSFGAKYAFQEEYLLLNAEVDKLIQHETFNQKIGFTQKIFFKRQLQNLAEDYHPASLLRNQFIGQRCIVLAGGPSLDENIDWIKAHQGQLFIFAVSRLSTLLIEKGITPHIVISVDPQQMNMDVSKDMLRLTAKTIFVNSNHVTPSLISQWRHKSVYLGSRYPWGDEEKEQNIETIGPTVTNATIHLAVEMGFTEILLSGVDFCYSSSGYSHTQSSIEAQIGPSLSTLGEWVETYAGQQAETPIQLLHAMHSLAEQAKNVSVCHIYNLSLNAAKIDGINYRNCDSFDFQPQSQCAFDTLHKLIPDADSETLTRDLTLCSRTIAATKKQFNAITRLAREAEDTNRKLKQSNAKPELQQTQANRLRQRMETIEKNINDKYPKLAKFIKFFGYAEFSRFLNPASTDEWDIDTILSMTAIYYQALAANSEYLSTLCTECDYLLASRLSELKIPPPVSALKTFWLQNLEPGRVLVWQDRNPFTKASLPPVDAAAIAYLEQAFEQSMLQEGTDITNVAKRANSLTGVQQKLVLLYRHKNRAALAQTVNLIKHLINQDREAERLYYLGQNYLHQIDNRMDAALNSLLSIAEDSRTETELREIVILSLSLQRLDLASEMLNKILAYSDEYAPQYAQLLKLQRQWQGAINVYLDYLEKYPGDVPTWLKLGQLMMELNERDAAITSFSNALQQQPDNPIAAHYLTQLSSKD